MSFDSSKALTRVVGSFAPNIRPDSMQNTDTQTHTHTHTKTEQQETSQVSAFREDKPKCEVCWNRIHTVSASWLGCYS